MSNAAAPLLPVEEPDDFGLMAALRGGESRAFDVLSGRWRPRLVNFFLGLGADPHGAEDCAQEALLRVYRYRDAYRPQVPFPAFLFTLARRSFLDWRRKTARWSRRAFPPSADRGPLLAEDGGAYSPDESVAHRDDASARHADRLDLAAAISTLPRRLRDVVELGAIRGLAYHQVGALLGLPVGTVKSRMHHAVRRLREALGDGKA